MKAKRGSSTLEEGFSGRRRKRVGRACHECCLSIFPFDSCLSHVTRQLRSAPPVCPRPSFLSSLSCFCFFSSPLLSLTVSLRLWGLVWRICQKDMRRMMRPVGKIIFQVFFFFSLPGIRYSFNFAKLKKNKQMFKLMDRKFIMMIVMSSWWWYSPWRLTVSQKLLLML